MVPVTQYILAGFPLAWLSQRKPFLEERFCLLWFDQSLQQPSTLVACSELGSVAWAIVWGAGAGGHAEGARRPDVPSLQANWLPWPGDQ